LYVVLYYYTIQQNPSLPACVGDKNSQQRVATGVMTQVLLFFYQASAVPAGAQNTTSMLEMRSGLRNITMKDEDRILIYKRTHYGDPDPQQGIFGNNGCMGKVRGLKFRAVIGIGGVGPEATSYGIEPRVMWIGITPRKVVVKDSRGPGLAFEHFLMYAPNEGPLLQDVAPTLAKHIYQGKTRYLINLTEAEYQEAQKILDMAKNAPPSNGGAGSNPTDPDPIARPSYSSAAASVQGQHGNQTHPSKKSCHQ
jgi:hypothetical protein